LVILEARSLDSAGSCHHLGIVRMPRCKDKGHTTC
jgi:hypothetical protein